MNMLKKIFAKKIQDTFPYILIVGGIMALYAAFALTIEKFAVLQNPDHHLSCSLDPVLACGPVMLSEQATAFWNIPNPAIGLAAFGMFVMTGLAMIAGAKMKRWFWNMYIFGVSAGLALVFWLMYQTVYSIGALCIYCMLVWAVMFSIGWYLFQYLLAEKHIKLNKKFTNFVRKHHFDILLVWFLLIVVWILNHFWYYYGPKLGF
ncbi:MAG TPA: vitamin K epoxide reductase family protein [Candidatus Saccharimonadales bacterium]|nr:vitamin K epoxide reductase family protein [Candidatus Saccharimonadales bacterium]